MPGECVDRMFTYINTNPTFQTKARIDPERQTENLNPRITDLPSNEIRSRVPCQPLSTTSLFRLFAYTFSLITVQISESSLSSSLNSPVRLIADIIHGSECRNDAHHDIHVCFDDSRGNSRESVYVINLSARVESKLLIESTSCVSLD